MTTADSALSDLAARLAGTDPTLSTSLRDILAAALQELIEVELTTLIGAAPANALLIVWRSATAPSEAVVDPGR